MSSVQAQADLFGRAARTVADLVATIPAAAWAGPGLGDWDLRALVGHTSRSLLTVEAYLDQPAAVEDLAGPVDYLLAIGRVDASSVVERGRAAGDALGDDPAAAVRAIVDRVLPLLDRDDDPLVTTIFGGMRLSTYLPTRSFELVVHGLDVADALGAPAPAFGAPLWSLALGLASEAAARGDRAPALLRALTGRHSLPEGFSVV
jgi:uncharacterized protein (TIGR03083 family)